MYTGNQAIIGSDPLLGNSSIEQQLQILNRQKQMLENAKQQRLDEQFQTIQKLIWDEIDSEISPMSNEQKNMLLKDEDYFNNYNILQSMVQSEILNLVKGRIENSQGGNEILTEQLKIVRKLKGRIIEDTNKEMELFRKFKDFSKANPGITYEEFIKVNK